jgi:hypothetical protein
MSQKSEPTWSRKIFRLTLASLVAFIVGVSLGLRDAYAESVSNIYVPDAGYVGMASTTGWQSGGVRFAIGSTGSSISMYYMFAGMRLWHLGNLDEEDYVGVNYTTSVSTATLSTVLYGEPFSTRSALLYSSSSHSALEYTSYYDKSGSCPDYWYYGIQC